MGKTRPSPAWLQLFPPLLASVTVNSCSEHVSCSKKQFWQMAACLMVYKEWYPKIIAFVLHLNSSCFHCKYEVLLALSCGVWYWENNLLRCHWREELKKEILSSLVSISGAGVNFEGWPFPPLGVWVLQQCHLLEDVGMFQASTVTCLAPVLGPATPYWGYSLNLFFPQITAYTVKYRIPFYSMALPHGWVFQLWKIAAEEKVNFCML